VPRSSRVHVARLDVEQRRGFSWREVIEAYRQWVISFPPPLRYLLAYDAALLSKTIRCFIGAVAHWQAI
jgi:hypothetical protein